MDNAEGAMKILRITPTLRIFSVEKATEFYLDYLGFKEDFRHQTDVVDGRGPVFLQISRDNLRLWLTEHYGDACPGSANYIEVTGLDAYLTELQAKNYPYLNPSIQKTPWNTRQLFVWDPFGNRLHFYETIQKDAQEPAAI